MAKILGLDVGTKRIGVAKADSDVRIAVPVETIEVDGKEFDRILQLSRLYNVRIIVVGLPRNSKGEETAQSAYARDFAKKLLGKSKDLKIFFQDESLTSVLAEERLKNKKSYEKGDIDAEAATIILQDFVEKITKNMFKTEPEIVENAKKKTKKSVDLKTLRKKIKKHPIISSVACAAVVLLAAFLILNSWYQSKLAPVYDESVCVSSIDCESSDRFVIESGESSSSIAERLESSNFIRSAFAFKIYLTLHGLSNNLKAGEYQLLRTSSVAEIAEILSSGEGSSAVFRLTILPGETLSNVKDRLLGFGYELSEIRDVLGGSEIDHPVLVDKPSNATLEGYLYGDTYEFYVGEDLKMIIRTILDELNRVVEENNLKEKYAAKGLSLHEGIILASIVQKEAKSADQPTVAQVFLSRLEQGIKLGSDVTVTYAVDQVDPYRRKYTDNESALAINSCYNTRLNAGLPCGPVSNPGLSALKAVAEPSDTSYLYFLTGDDGKMYYSYTDAEHLQKITEYCKKLCAESL